MRTVILTEIQEEVLVHILLGRTSKEIAEHIGKSKSTVDGVALHLNQIFDSLTRIGLIVNACQFEMWRNILLSDESLLKQNRLKPDLTIRQLELLQHLLDGLTSKEASDLLSINIRSTENARLRIMKKWDIKLASELVQVSFAKGYLKFDGFEENGN